MADKPKLAVGMKLWWVPSRTYSQPSEVTVEKVGRTWAQLSNRSRADVKTWVVDGYGYAPPGSIWPSREVHEEWAARQACWRDFLRDVGRIYSAPENISIEEINQIRRLIGLEVLEPSNG